ncbi:MAG: ATP-grasp domain-containing protein [Planctomycetes bacterium]|nr:ATP-grasp domain-containing protein [Planctomycetota bacterium]
MHVLFVEPAFPKTQREHVRALHAVGARVTGIGERSPEALDPELRSWLDGYEQVRSVVDEAALEAAVRRVQARGWVDRLETTVEAHVLPVAHVRERCAIPGTSVRTAFLCRDKAAMKHALREAGVPCAASTGASDGASIREFARRVGYPVIVKPLAAAGAAGAMRADDDAQLEAAIAQHGVDRGQAVAVEEFIDGHEGFWDTVSIGGHVLHEFVCHYYPNVLEAMRTRWISPQIVCTNRVELDSYRELRELGRKVLGVLGIETSATHMEWFFGAKGLKFSEIGCRPPGVGVWDLYSAANEIDLYSEWAKAVVHGRSDARLSRRYACGMIALRPDRDGRIVRYDGLEAMRQRYGSAIVKEYFPPPGTATQGVENGYHANAWLVLRHPDYDTLRGMLDDVGRTVKVRAQG